MKSSQWNIIYNYAEGHSSPSSFSDKWGSWLYKWRLEIQREIKITGNLPRMQSKWWCLLCFQASQEVFLSSCSIPFFPFDNTLIHSYGLAMLFMCSTKKLSSELLTGNNVVIKIRIKIFNTNVVLRSRHSWLWCVGCMEDRSFNRPQTWAEYIQRFHRYSSTSPRILIHSH